MRSLRPRFLARLRPRAAAYLVLLIALVPTFIAYWRAETNVRNRDEARFDALMNEAEKAIQGNLDSLASDLVAVSGFFEANANVSYEEWRVFVSRLELDRRHPGIRSVGYSEKVFAKES